MSLISDLQKSPRKLKKKKKKKKKKERLIYEYTKIRLKTIYISYHSFKTS